MIRIVAKAEEGLRPKKPCEAWEFINQGVRNRMYRD